MKPIILTKKISGLKSGIKGFYFKEKFITDPYLDETGRFEVSPTQYYGLTDKQMEIWQNIN